MGYSDGSEGSGGSVAGALNNAAGAPKMLKAMIGEARYGVWFAEHNDDLPMTFWFHAWDELKAEFERLYGSAWEYQLSMALEAEAEIGDRGQESREEYLEQDLRRSELR